MELLLSMFQDELRPVRDNLRSVRDDLRPVQQLIPMVCNMSLSSNNLWTPSAISEHGKRDDSMRALLKAEMGYSKKGKVRCMLTGETGGGDCVVCGHIVPCSSKAIKIQSLGLTLDDLNTSPNLVFWAINIERAYEKLQISFVKSVSLNFTEEYVMKIWDDSIRASPIWKGSLRTIGEFENKPLILGKHVIMKRGLSFHAIQAYNTYSSSDLKLGKSCLYGSPGNYSYLETLALLRKDFDRDLDGEVGSDREVGSDGEDELGDDE